MMDVEKHEIHQTSWDSPIDQDTQDSQMETSQGKGREDDTITSHLGCETSIPIEGQEVKASCNLHVPETQELLQPDHDTCTLIDFNEKDTEIHKQTKLQTATCMGQIENDWREPGEYGFPDNLEGFKYTFNEYGQLRHIETMAPFKFDVRKDDMRYNQLHYEALGEVISEHIYGLLESETNLVKAYLGDFEDEPRSFIFMSKNALTTKDKLLILIHGSGVVRAGQWARRLIINDCLDSGTQLPYIKKAREEGYEVLVMNTNHNYAIGSDGQRIAIKGSSSPKLHGLHVWDQFVSETPAKHVAVVAHSYGGIVTIELAVHRMESFRRKVVAVAFTDSIHTLHYDRIGDELHTWFVNNAANWVASSEELDTVVDDRGYDCKRISAGTMKHEETSWYSLQSIFEFLRAKTQGLENPQQEETSETKEYISKTVGKKMKITHQEGEEQDGGEMKI